jgi:hypothetical protein
MARPNAWRIVAAMKDAHADRDFAAMDYPRSPVRKKGFAIPHEAPISMDIATTFPRPAFVAFLNSHPENSLNRHLRRVAIKTFKPTKPLIIARVNSKSLQTSNAFTIHLIPSGGIRACATTELSLIYFNLAWLWMENFPACPAAARKRWFHSRHFEPHLITIQAMSDAV